MRSCLALLSLALAKIALAYIPAVPTNDTSLPVFNASSLSSVQLRWQQLAHQPMGVYSTAVSYQLAGEGSNGVTQGAIVHFTESNAKTNDTTTTPWIAFISCDANDTDASMEEDIFTMAQERGALSALLYSQYSQACLINAEYLSPEFAKLVDVFATTSSKTASLIESQFGEVNETLYYYFDAERLNASATLVNQSLLDQSDDQPAYLVARLLASNATGNATTPSSGGGGGGSATVSSSSTPNTGLAMIILYAITGCVSVLFCVVILSGAVRAIRHPERYGPRTDPTYLGGPPPQTRTAGITRAILDTFPVIKFGGGTNSGMSRRPSNVEGSRPDAKEMGLQGDVEAGRFSVDQRVPETGRRLSTGEPLAESSHPYSPPDPSLLADPNTAHALALSRSLSPPPTSPTRRSASPPRYPPVSPIPNDPSSPTPLLHHNPASPTPRHTTERDLGHDTCPICIVDFEPGDDLRVLPCEGRHRFHKDCVDPWLLELSSSCPICRQDFQALEIMATSLPDSSQPPHETAHDDDSEPGLGLGLVPRRRRLQRRGSSFTRFIGFGAPGPSARRPSSALVDRDRDRDDRGGMSGSPIPDALPPHPLA